MSENNLPGHQLPLTKRELTHAEYIQIMRNTVFEKRENTIRFSSPDIPLAVECGLFDDETNKYECFWALDRIMAVSVANRDEFSKGQWEAYYNEIMSKQIIEK